MTRSVEAFVEGSRSLSCRPLACSNVEEHESCSSVAPCAFETHRSDGLPERKLLIGTDWHELAAKLVPVRAAASLRSCKRSVNMYVGSRTACMRGRTDSR